MVYAPGGRVVGKFYSHGWAKSASAISGTGENSKREGSHGGIGPRAGGNYKNAGPRAFTVSENFTADLACIIFDDIFEFKQFFSTDNV